MMAAIGEGFEVLEKSEFDFDYENVARVWNFTTSHSFMAHGLKRTCIF
jgi:6-phosphogluconate dehydrogenase (decarboxylating)